MSQISYASFMGLVEYPQSKWKKLLPFVAIIVVIGVGAALFILTRKPEPKIVPAEVLRNTDALAYQYAKTGDINGALKVYDRAIAKYKDKNMLGLLYLQKASYELTVNKSDLAVRDSLKAESLIPSVTTTASVADAYAQAGNKAKAAEYYRKAASLVSANAKSGFSSEYYTNKARQQEGSQ